MKNSLIKTNGPR